MSHRAIPRAAANFNFSTSRLLRQRAIEPPYRSIIQAAPQAQRIIRPSRPFTSSPALYKKAGKANKAHARSDSAPPDRDISVTPTDEAYDVSVLEAAILRAIERLTHELAQLRAGGRLNPNVVENLRVQLGTAKDGKETVRLGDIAQVIPKGRFLNVMVSEKDHIKPVTSAIYASNHNLAPQQPHPDAPLTIPVPIPPPTGESRQAALEAAQKAAEQADKAIQNARAAHHKKLRKFELEKAVLPDDLQKAKKRMEEVVKKGHGEVKHIVDGAKKVLQSQ
ncbi:ribosome recycling factor [Westerdykella ornata]|uniref:Ribosome recycling factor n=1 Tax=Westerdykella ornata TaxID=318751 RepID=A0A6A6JKL3_WESOR|nr:ribosome recycling factor [Westerdykella ornata]KAF2276653.1 ribosome recycling factor [Westerdykella ornata]